MKKKEYYAEELEKSIREKIRALERTKVLYRRIYYFDVLGFINYVFRAKIIFELFLILCFPFFVRHSINMFPSVRI